MATTTSLPATIVEPRLLELADAAERASAQPVENVTIVVTGNDAAHTRDVNTFVSTATPDTVLYLIDQLRQARAAAAPPF